MFFNGTVINSLWAPNGVVSADQFSNCLSFTLSEYTREDVDQGKEHSARWSAGEIGFYPAGSARLHNFGSSGARLGYLSIPDKNLEQLMPLGEWGVFKHKIDNLALSMLMATALLDPDECPLEADYLMMAIFQRVAGWHRKPNQSSGPPGRIGRVIDYMNDNCADRMTLAELAAVACLSSFHFLRQFKKATGRTPHGYVRDRRVLRARSLIGAGMALAAVALCCGFATQSHLNKHFKTATGVTPGAYRRMLSSGRQE